MRQGIEANSTLADIYREANYVVETRILPSLQELRKKLELERGRLWRRVILQGSTIIPSFLLNWITNGALTAAIKAMESSKDMGLYVMQRQDAVDAIKAQGGLGYLLEIVDHPIFKNKDTT